MVNGALLEEGIYLRECYSMLDGIPVGLYISGLEGELIYANQALVEILKAPDLESLLKFNIWNLYVNVNDRKRLINKLQENEKKFIHNFETIIRCFDGSIIWVNISAKLVEKKEKLLIVAIQDITNVKQNRKALAEIEAKFRTITEMAPDAIILIDLEGRIIFWNKAAKKIFDYTSQEIIGQSLQLLIASDRYYRYYKKVLSELKETGKNRLKGKIFRIKAKRKDGSIFPVEISHNFFKIENQDTLICIIRDITLQKKIEKYIKRKEKILKIISEIASLLLHTTSYKKITNDILNLFGRTIDVDKIYIYQIIYNSNNKIFATTKYKWIKNEEININSSNNLDIIDYNHPILKHIQKALSHKEVFIIQENNMSDKEKQFLKKEKIKSIAISPIFVDNKWWGFISLIQCNYRRTWTNVEIDALRSFTNMLGVAIQREKFAEELIREKERLDITVKSIADGVIVVDISGKIILINKGAQKILKYDIEIEIESGKVVFLKDIFRLFYEKTGQPEDILEAVLKHKQTVRLLSNTVVQTKNGEYIPIQVVASPIKDRKGQIIGIVIIFQDITRRRLLEQEILHQEKTKVLEMLAGGIAHDFNNLLVAILGNISLAKIKNQEHNINKFLERAEKAAKQAEKLTSQLLMFTRSGLPVKKTTSISELVKETVFFVLRGTNIKVIFSIPEDLWPAKVDEVQISQVLQNLVINAQQAMPEGGIIEISARNVWLEKETEIPLPPGPYICLKVKDYGCGIPPEYLSYIFDPYFTTKPDGTGLGLAVVLSIIKKHDGYIRVRSTVGYGTTFEIFLPAVEKEETVLKDIQEEKNKEMDPKTKGKILILDDEELIRETLREMLSLIGYTVETAQNGEEAIEKYRKAFEKGNPFDVIIMDLTIPGGMGGKEALKEILKIDPCALAVVSSGYTNSHIVSEYHLYGFKGILKKPYRMEDLKKLLQELLSKRQKT